MLPMPIFSHTNTFTEIFLPSRYRYLKPHVLFPCLKIKYFTVEEELKSIYSLSEQRGQRKINS